MPTIFALNFKFFSFMGSLPCDFLIRGSAPGLARGKDSRLSYVHPCMPVIPLVPSDPPTLISSLLRLSAHHLALAASASQPLKSRTLSLPLSLRTCTSPNTFRRHLKTRYCQQAFQSTYPLSSCASDSALLTIVRVYKLYLLPYLFAFVRRCINREVQYCGRRRYA